MQADLSTLVDRRMAVGVEIADLEAAQGAAMLDGQSFDEEALTAKRTELEAIGAAELEALRRERMARAESGRQRRNAIRAEMGKTHAEYAKAVKQAETAAKSLALALDDARTHAEQLHRQCVGIGATPPIGLTIYSVADTLSRLIAGELTDVQGRCYYGVIKWPSVTRAHWSHHLDNVLTPALQALMKEENA